MTVKVFVLTDFIFKLLKGRNLIRQCRECGSSFEIDDVVVSLCNYKTRWYCRKCAIKFKLI